MPTRIPQSHQVILPHITAAHQDAAFRCIIQAGDQLHQGGLGRTSAAQDAHCLAGLNGQVHVGQGILGSIGMVLEADIFKPDTAVGDLGHRMDGGWVSSTFSSRISATRCALANDRVMSRKTLEIIISEFMTCMT